MILLETSNLAGGWDTFWGSLTGAWPGLTTILNLIAVVVLVVALSKWVWQRKQGLTGGNNQGLWGSLLVAAFFALPGVFVPLALKLADLFINFVVRISQQIT